MTLAKLWFLLSVVPGLPEGTFAEFVFVMTLGVIGGRLLSFGSEEQLPLEVAGQLQRAVEYLCFYAVMFGSATIVMVIYLAIRSSEVAGLCLGISLAGTFVLSGIIRTLSSYSYEWLINWPWVIFPLLVATAQPDDAKQLLILLAISHLATQLVVGFLSRLIRPANFFARQRIGRSWRSIVLQGSQKVFSTILLVLDLRGLIIWPKLVKGLLVSDTLALTLSVAESIWQVGMVVVNREYNRFCKKTVSKRDVALGALIITGIFAMCALAISIGHPIVSNVIAHSLPWNEIVVAIIFMTVVALFIHYRNFFWSIGMFGRSLLVAQIVLFVGQMFVVDLLPEERWLRYLVGFSILWFILFIGPLIFRRRSMSAPTEQSRL